MYLIMKCMVVILVYCVNTISCQYSTAQTQIIGGSEVNIADYPYQATLFIVTNGTVYFICGGSIVSKFYVITAAHCTNGYTANNMAVGVGATDWSKGTYYGVTSVDQHANYNQATTDFDISVLKLKDSLTYSANVAPIPISTILPPEGSTAVVSGWGATYKGSDTKPQNLKAVTVDLIADCSPYYGTKITSQMFCAGTSAGGSDACQGDSGGPLAYNGTLIGVVSWGIGCGRADKPGVYTHVPELKNWISNRVVFDEI